MSPLPLAKLILENMAFSADHTFWYRTEKQTSMLPSPTVTGHAGQPKTFPWDRPPVTYSPEWRMEEFCVREPTSKREKVRKELSFTDSLINHRSMSVSESAGDPECYTSVVPSMEKKTASLVWGIVTPTQHPAPSCSLIYLFLHLSPSHLTLSALFTVRYSCFLWVLDP